VALGGVIEMSTRVVAVTAQDDQVQSVTVRSKDGVTKTIDARAVISTMPMRELVESIVPTPPAAVVAAGSALHYRDFLTVALVVPNHGVFPDNWIYIHSPEVKVGRIQNFGSWSPYMVKDGKTCLGLEYFVFEDDELWSSSDEDLVALATSELERLGLVPKNVVERGYVVRVPKAYPYYDGSYKENVAIIDDYLQHHVAGVHLIGRNGMHKYNNQDHSMLTAMLTVENLRGAQHDIWAVNVEEEYHEQSGSSAGREGTGRDAPILPARPSAS